jgi:hypothetical protein
MWPLMMVPAATGPLIRRSFALAFDGVISVRGGRRLNPVKAMSQSVARSFGVMGCAEILAASAVVAGPSRFIGATTALACAVSAHFEKRTADHALACALVVPVDAAKDFAPEGAGGWRDATWP